MALGSRLSKIEKALAAAGGERRAYSHLQLLRAARGQDPGLPAVVLRPGEKSHAQIIHETLARARAAGHRQ